MASAGKEMIWMIDYLEELGNEYVASAGKEMIWMIDYLEELGKKQHEKILQVDS